MAEEKGAQIVSIGYGILNVPLEIAHFSLVRCRALEKLEEDEHKFYQAEKGKPSDWSHVELDWASSGNAKRFMCCYLQNKEKIDTYLNGRDLSTLTKQEVHELLDDLN